MHFVYDEDPAIDVASLSGRGLHSYPFQLNLGCFLGHMIQLKPIHVY